MAMITPQEAIERAQAAVDAARQATEAAQGYVDAARAMADAMASPEVTANFAKQNFNRVPSASLDEAKTWLAGEMALWTKITQEVPIEMPQ